MKIVLSLSYTFALILALITTNGCKKFKGFSKENLSFTSDTLVFDTVFTTIGSTTKNFRIHNKENKAVKIEEIELMGGANSFFRINMDGIQGTLIKNIEIPAKDSLYCFVEVTLSVNNQTLPMVVEDSIRFRTNGKDQYVKLVVWGQDVYYHYSNIPAGIFDTTEGTWPNDKPHLIYGAAFVDSAKTLNILAGTKIFMHGKSILWNYKGTLNIDGDYNNKVEIRGDRLESFYEDVANSYYGIYFQKALPSSIDNLDMKNANVGIHVDSKDPVAVGTTLTIKNTEINNSGSFGILLFDNPIVTGENILVHHSGIHSLIVLQGADFNFNHCDFLGYGTGDFQNASVGLKNYFTNAQGTTTISSIPQGTFTNCVLYGSGEEQLVFDTISAVGVDLNFSFRNCVIKNPSSSNPFFQLCQFNENPNFINTSSNDFKFSLPSSLSNTGNVGFPTSTGSDLLNTIRSFTASDVGCYEIM